MNQPNAISINEGEKQVAMFKAPDDKYAAAGLWVFLVENLRPGLSVDLWLPGIGKISSPTAVAVPTERYAAIMNGAN